MSIARYGFLLVIALLLLLTLLQGRRARAFVLKPLAPKTYWATSTARIRRNRWGSGHGGNCYYSFGDFRMRRVDLANWCVCGDMSRRLRRCNECSTRNFPNGIRPAAARRTSAAIVRMSGSDENRSVQEEWPFHKSRYTLTWPPAYILRTAAVLTKWYKKTKVGASTNVTDNIQQQFVVLTYFLISSRRRDNDTGL